VKKSLYLKFMIPVLVVVLVSILIMAWAMPVLINKNTEDEARRAAVKTVSQFKTLRGYYTKNIVKKAVAQGGLKPSIDHQGDPEKIPLPATMIHDLSKLLAEEGTTLKLYSAFPFPNRKLEKMDDFGLQAWQQLSKNPTKPFYRSQDIRGERHVRVGVADTMVAQGCVNCHNSHPDTPKTDWKLGDLRGVLEVSVSIEDQLTAAHEVSNKIIAILVITMALISLAIFLVYRKTIGIELKKVTSSLTDIAQGEGDLTQRLDESQEDEIGDLSRVFNQFQEQIRQMIQTISGSVGGITNEALKLSSVSKETTTAMSEQTAQTHKASSSIHSIAEAMKDIALAANQALERSQKSEQLALQSKHTMDNNITLVKELELEVQQIGGTMKELTEDSEKIGGVLDVIEQISEQTNLLALNAAIEAARAGEHGRGFAVVADEVRNLAAKTQESTVEIQAIIQRLQASVSSAHKAMDKNTENTAETLKGINDAGSSLGQVVDSMVVITEQNQQIANITQTHNQALDTVSENMETISDGTDQVAQATENIAASSVEVSNIAKQLQTMISRFKY